MAKATAHCTCSECGTKFEKTSTQRNRKEADNWEKWAEENFTLCGPCWGAEQRAEEQKKPLSLVIDCDPYGQRIVVHFSGGTMAHKDEIKALGYKWGDLPMVGMFGLLNKRSMGWFKIVDFDDMENVLAEAKDLRPQLVNNISEVDAAIYANIRNKREEEKKEQGEIAAKIAEEKAKLTKPERPETLEPGKRWNGKVYGASGRRSIYLDGEQVKLSDPEAKAIENYLAAIDAYDEAIKEIEQKAKKEKTKDQAPGRVTPRESLER